MVLFVKKMQQYTHHTKPKTTLVLV